MDLGKRIRELRKKNRMTLAQVSQKSGVALATISRIETGTMTGTLQSHLRIAKTFGLPLSEFYRDMDQPSSLKKESYGEVFVKNKKTSSLILTKDVLNKKMLPVLLRLTSGGQTRSEELRGGAEKFVFVLQGKVEISVGATRTALERGGALYFDATQPHSIRNTHATTAECIIITTPAVL